jgi:putative ABC transport system permease protein
MLSTLLSDLRFAVRSAVRRPAFTIVVVATLALGIGANTAMFSLINEALLRPLPYEDPERLVLARTTFGGRPNLWSSLPDYLDYREQATSLETLAAVGGGTFPLPVRGGERPELVPSMIVSVDLHPMLGVPPVAGRLFAAGEGEASAPYVALVSEGYARRRFGGARDALGRTLTTSLYSVEGPVTATVVGVMPAAFRFLDDVDLWIPMRRGEERGEGRQFHNWRLYGRLKPGVTIERAQREVDVISKRLQQQYPDTNTDKALRLDPLQPALLEAQTPWLMVLTAAVALVLLIACANVAGLLLARGATRRSEMAVRSALGASRARLAALLMTESLLLAVVSGAAGLAVAFWLGRLLPIATGLSEAGVTSSGIDVPVLLFALAISAATGLLSGVAPALRASSLDPAGDLAHGGRATEMRGGTRLRGTLVVGQVAISLVLLASAGLLIRSFSRLATTDLGFDTEHLLTADIQLLDMDYPEDHQRVRLFRGLQDDLAALPGVASVSFVSHLPIRHPWSNPPAWPADNPPADPSERRTAHWRVVMPGYFDAVGMPLLAGRDLATTDRADAPNVVVVNETLARRFFPGQEPLGQRLTVDGDPPETCEVVGVVADARINYVFQDVREAAYTPYFQEPRPTMRLVLRSSLHPDVLAATVREVIAARDRNVLVANTVTMERLIGDSLVSQRVTAVTLTIFSILALLLASLGLYGVLAYYVAQRTHEIGVRIAIGAEPGDVLRHVLRRSGMMVLPGLALGLVASLASVRLIENLLYEVPATDPATFVTVIACLAAVALAASAWPAWRATRIDPVRALRAE